MCYIYVCVCAHTYIYMYMYIYTADYLGIRKKEILPFVTTWMVLEGIMLRKLEKNKYYMIFLIYAI